MLVRPNGKAFDLSHGQTVSRELMVVCQMRIEVPMSVRAASSSDMAGLLAQADFGVLIRMLADEGYTVIGPRVEAEAVTYREIQHADELPAGWGSRQEGGRYRLERRRDDALFGYVQGVQSWRPHLFRPSRTLWRAQRTE